MTAPIEFRAFSKRYGSACAVEDASFVVEGSRVTGLLGGNGAGKTTCLRAIVGLIEPTNGSVLVRGRRFPFHTGPGIVGSAIDGEGFSPGSSIRRELDIWAAALGVGPGRVVDVLEEVGLCSVQKRPVSKLSQGMRQRLALALALLSEPEILVLDEPTNGLDPSGIRWLRNMLRSLANGGTAVLLSSHMLSEVEDTVDDVVILERTVRFSGPLTALTDDGKYRLEDKFFALINGGEAIRDE